MTYQIRSLSESFGAEVLEFAIDGIPPSQVIAEVRRLWGIHKILLFRNQGLGEKSLVEFSRCLGELEIHVRKEYLSIENPEILYVSNKINGFL